MPPQMTPQMTPQMRPMMVPISGMPMANQQQIPSQQPILSQQMPPAQPVANNNIQLDPFGA